jgi:hypothetical protein
MKTGMILIVLLLCFGTIQAQQKIEKHINFSGKESLAMNIQIADSIDLHTWNKNEVFVTASININENKDNEAYLTSFDDQGNSVVIKSNFKENYFKEKNNCCIKSQIYWEVYMPEKAYFTLETIDANITITGKTEKMKVKSISGYIDLAVPPTREADLEFSTISGTIYSNHDINLTASHSGIPSSIRGKLNNGGSKINLETVSGDIFFRKSNIN